jgi:hypothetical protein
MSCTCYIINNPTVPITHTELMTRQPYTTPEPVFTQASVGGIDAIHGHDALRQTIKTF